VFLVSDGLDAGESSAGGAATASTVELLGSDASGENVFFTTVDRLVPADTDSQLDIYDARVGGGFPAEVTSPICESGGTCRPGSCQGGQAECTAPEQPLGSSIFSGPGNLRTSPFVAPPPPKKKTAAQLRAEKLTKALKLCREQDKGAKKHHKRQACEKTAKKRYSPIKKAKAKKKAKSNKGRK
jgi:hypothetical protein